MEILDEGIVSSKEILAEVETGIIPEVKEPAKLIEFIPNLDVCFMLDCTGSMQSYIDRAKNKIKDIIEEVKEQYPSSEIHVGIVGYRDFDNPQFEILQFTPNIPVARDFIDKIRAFGGADCPEDVNGGFQKALFELEWQGQARMIVHIADAPCHGKEFHTTGDTYPNGHKDDKPWEDIFKKIVDTHTDYLFLKINNITDKMFTKFKEIAEGVGALEKGVLFKQEPISNIEQAAAAAFGTGSLFAPVTTVTPTTLVPTTFERAKKKRAVPKKESVTVSKAKKEKTTTRSTSRKATTKSDPKDKKKKTTKMVSKDEDSEDEEIEEDKDWVEPKYWTRSKAREWKERQSTLKDKKSPRSKSKKTSKKGDDMEEEKGEYTGSGYWTIPVRKDTPVTKDLTSSPTVTRSTRKKSDKKERERSAARDKRDADTEAPKKRGRKPKTEMSTEKSTKKKVIKAPVSKALRKAPSFEMPSMAGMSAMDEAEYFAKLLSKEMKDSIHRKKEGMKE